ncbi:unnamed protein product [Orchesella dallaii]|uniref:Uncharacterized protein n=1 Tax=Orchesella dallaii TaxID=48710 RepID=A0ABP1QJJ5_9HEXA
MRSLYACIGKELYDERNTLTIMFGRICSLCEIEDTDVELEYDYKHKEVNSSTSDSDEDHHKRHNSKDSKAPSATVSKGAIDDDSPSNTTRPSTATLGRSRPTNASTLGVRKVGPAPAGRGRGRGRGKPTTDDIK